MTRAVRGACLLSLLVGLLFLFVRAPHPWGWNGFDHYHEFALALASGQPFPTMEVPWGYAYFLAAYAIWIRPARRYVIHALVLLVCAGATLTPWVVRNYRLTKTIVPTSVHGGAQLWYGTLQVGPYLESRGYNPRSVFETPAFEYTSLDAVPILVHGGVRTCVFERGGTLSLFYWTDFDPVKHRVSPAMLNPVTGRFTFELPPPEGDTAVYYYYFEAIWPFDSPRERGSLRASPMTIVDTPALGANAPALYFVSQDHLGDMDRYHDLLDVFDVIRLARHEAWGEPLA